MEKGDIIARWREKLAEVPARFGYPKRGHHYSEVAGGLVQQIFGGVSSDDDIVIKEYEGLFDTYVSLLEDFPEFRKSEFADYEEVERMEHFPDITDIWRKEGQQGDFSAFYVRESERKLRKLPEH